MGYRVRKLRKTLDLTQKEFGSRIGIKGNTVAQYELGRSNPVDSVVSLIIREYNVSEEWLRNGEGEMFRPTPSSALEQLAKDYNLSNAASKIIEKFVTLKPEKRKELLDLFLEIAKVLEESDIDTSTPAIPENQFPNFSQDSLIETIRQNVPKTPEELEKRFPPVEPRSNTNTGKLLLNAPDLYSFIRLVDKFLSFR